MDQFLLQTDGGSRGNPGPAAIGYVVKNKNGTTLLENGEKIEDTTNNQAEYRALLHGLNSFKRHLQNEQNIDPASVSVQILTDSELLQKQLDGIYQTNHSELQSLQNQILDVLDAFDEWAIKHVPREENQDADRLVNKALDQSSDQQKSATTSRNRKNDPEYFTVVAHGVGGSSQRTAGWAYIVRTPENEELLRKVEKSKEHSANEMTYLALNDATETLHEILSSPENSYAEPGEDKLTAGVEIKTRNEVVLKQLTGEYSTSDTSLKRIRNQIQSTLDGFQDVHFTRGEKETTEELRRLARKGEEY